jgi:SAM-dependent methyltransferase
LGANKTIAEIGGGLSPVQFMLANHGCNVINMDIDFERTWFPTQGKYYIRASPQFIAESEKNATRIQYMRGSVFDEIKKIPSNSVDAAIETCAIHLFIGDGRNGLMDQIARILKPGGYFISIGDVANPHLGKCDHEFQYPKEMAQALCANAHLQLVKPYDYETWEKELTDYTHIIPRRNVDYTELSLLNMKNDPKSIPYNNVPTYPIHLWTATYILQKDQEV